MNYKNDHLKIINEKYESKLDDYGKIDEEGIGKNNNRKLGELPIHQFLQQLVSNDFLWAFNAVSLYPSVMSDEKST